MTQIVAAIPGRLRIRDAALHQPARLQALQTRLLALPGVLSARGNAAAASLVLHYDAAQQPPHEMQTLVGRTADSLLQPERAARAPSSTARPTAAPPRVPAEHRASPAGRRRALNRVAKISMLASLTTSLALAAAGNKRWHAATGAFFVAWLGVHLATHRRHLLR